MNNKIVLPENVEFIINALESNGFKAYIVGGCVRDMLLGLVPKDFDITTSAHPENVINLFDKVIPTGIKHGTVTICINNENYEVTTFRNDGEYEDGRHPKKVTFVNELYEDLNRRDFTINAMAYNHKTGIVDYFKGMSDLKSKIIKAVGIPEKRFEEDALRMLRAVRFSAQLKFNIEDNTLNAIKTMKDGIIKVSIERIRDEFNKILLNDPSKLKTLKECGLLELIIDDINKMYDFDQNNKYHKYDLFEHSILTTINIELELHLRLAMLMHDFGKIDVKTTDNNGNSHYHNHEQYSYLRAESILKKMKYEKETIKRVLTLIKYHDVKIESKIEIKQLLNKIGIELFKDLIKVKKADLSAKDELKCKSTKDVILFVQNELDEIIENNECYTIKQMEINGNDLIELGITGKDIGLRLNSILHEVIKDNKLNERNKLLKMAISIKNN